MDTYTTHCQTFGIPLWVAPLLHAASRHRSDHARRKKAYRLIHRTLYHKGVGCQKGVGPYPTYVYPTELKQLLRTVFPEDVCDFPDPCHRQMVKVTMEDLEVVKPS
ncbi:hypothetical protein DPEC_G00020570 [Dallia pectoralis]|uniref:Uncharacterized protein n=1 Tax=Dallia pectoralis TaxID=75939 RepID=A0ACC2HG13_DALPE|nr:hypothetical protein DPEC_G00020570 [Dallia pectoralis]